LTRLASGWLLFGQVFRPQLSRCASPRRWFLADVRESIVNQLGKPLEYMYSGWSTLEPPVAQEGSSTSVLVPARVPLNWKMAGYCLSARGMFFVGERPRVIAVRGCPLRIGMAAAAWHRPTMYEERTASGTRDEQGAPWLVSAIPDL
jgi:hypothetical protein